MMIISKTLDVSYTVNELTQGMAEQILDRMETTKDLEGLKFQSAYIDITREVGWLVLAQPASELTRRTAIWLFRKLTAIWEEANTLPND